MFCFLLFVSSVFNNMLLFILSHFPTSDSRNSNSPPPPPASSINSFPAMGTYRVLLRSIPPPGATLPNARLDLGGYTLGIGGAQWGI